MAETATCYYCKGTYPVRKMKKSAMHPTEWICKDEMACLRRSEKKAGL